MRNKEIIMMVRFLRIDLRLMGMVVAASLLMMGVGTGWVRAENSAPSDAFHPERFTSLGQPVLRNAIYNHVLGTDGEGHPRYYQAYRGTPWFLLSIDPETGQTVQYTATGHNGNPWGMIWASDHKLYITTGGGGADDVFVFDPKTNSLNYLGRPTNTEVVIWSLSEGQDGKIYGGTYPNAKLISIDMKTGKLADLGRISPDQMYIRTLTANGPYVYCNAGPSQPQVWAYDTRNGHKSQMLPDALHMSKFARWGTAETRADGQVYVYVPGKDYGYRVEGSKLGPRVESLPAKIHENLQGTSERDPVKLADGSTISVDVNSGPDGYFYRSKPGEAVKKIHVEYTGSPAPLWAVQEGPDGAIYGTTRTPITLYRWDPNAAQAKVLGNPMGTKGQVYGWLWHKGRLYMAAYGGSQLAVWDPGRAWHFGDKPEDNPRTLGSCHISRPASLIVAPDGEHLLVGGVPAYGVTGGILTILDPATGKIEVVKGLFGDQSIASMASVPGTDLVCIGTTWRGGSASNASASPPQFILWNFKTRKVEFRMDALSQPATLVQMDLVDGKIYCTTSDDSGHLVVFDPATRRVVHSAPLGFGPGTLFGLRYRSGDGMIYALSGESILRINPRTYAITRLGAYPGMKYGMALGGDYIYFCADDRLMRFAIPENK
jgi:hypothetical protein